MKAAITSSNCKCEFHTDWRRLSNILRGLCADQRINTEETLTLAVLTGRLEKLYVDAAERLRELESKSPTPSES